MDLTVYPHHLSSWRSRQVCCVRRCLCGRESLWCALFFQLSSPFCCRFALLDQSALDQLEIRDRRDYDRALENAPELVRQESPIKDFLITEGNNAYGAAVRLCNYWKSRHQIFGERWLLPLIQTGTGALNRDDIELLRTGSYVVIPRPSPSADSTVLLYDESRLPRPAGKSLVRCVFYLASVFRQYTNNITFVHVVTAGTRPPVDLDPSRWATFKTSLPIRVQSIIVAQAHEGPGREALIDYMAFQSTKATEFKSQLRAHRIAAPTPAGTLALLQQGWGLEAECLPRSLGGSYDCNKQFAEWIRMRLSIEDVTSAAPLRCYKPSIVPQVTSIHSVARRGVLCRVADEQMRRKRRKALEGSAATAAAQASDEQQDGEVEPSIARERARNALYARRSYQKRKLELLTLQNQCQVWTE